MPWSGFPFSVNSASPQPMMSPSREGVVAPVLPHIVGSVHAVSLGLAVHEVSMRFVSSCPSHIGQRYVTVGFSSRCKGADLLYRVKLHQNDAPKLRVH